MAAEAEAIAGAPAAKKAKPDHVGTSSKSIPAEAGNAEPRRAWTTKELGQGTECQIYLFEFIGLLPCLRFH